MLRPRLHTWRHGVSILGDPSIIVKVTFLRKSISPLNILLPKRESQSSVSLFFFPPPLFSSTLIPTFRPSLHPPFFYFCHRHCRHSFQHAIHDHSQQVKSGHDTNLHLSYTWLAKTCLSLLNIMGLHASLCALLNLKCKSFQATALGVFPIGAANCG